MKLLPSAWSKRLTWLAMLMMAAVAALGWQPSPWQGQVRVFRSEFHRAKIPYEAGMRVRDAIAMSRAVLGKRENEIVVVYRWRPWLPERIPDAAVLGLQGALATAGMHRWSNALWTWWDGFVPRQNAWHEVARDQSAHDRFVESGEMIVLRTAP